MAALVERIAAPDLPARDILLHERLVVRALDVGKGRLRRLGRCAAGPSLRSGWAGFAGGVGRTEVRPYVKLRT